MKHSEITQQQEELIRWQFEEAKWLDGIVRPMLPQFLVYLVEGLIQIKGLKWLGRFVHVLTDTIYIGLILRLRITRSRELEVQGGKGFRPGHARSKVRAIRTKVERKGKVVAEKSFPVLLDPGFLAAALTQKQ